jgi:hypothetical protein
VEYVIQSDVCCCAPPHRFHHTSFGFKFNFSSSLMCKSRFAIDIDPSWASWAAKTQAKVRDWFHHRNQHLSLKMLVVVCHLLLCPINRQSLNAKGRCPPSQRIRMTRHRGFGEPLRCIQYSVQSLSTTVFTRLLYKFVYKLECAFACACAVCVHVCVCVCACVCVCVCMCMCVIHTHGNTHTLSPSFSRSLSLSLSL